MNKYWKRVMIMLGIVLTLLSLGTNAIADDGHDDDDEKHEYYQKFSEDDDDDDDDWEAPQNQIINQQQTEFWNIWSREPQNNPDNPLPLGEPGELTVSLNNNETTIYVIPQEGQLLVSAEKIAEVLGAESQLYSQSKISILTKDGLELIVKAGSNAAFENKVKNPMPIQAAFYEKSVYLPVSVAANALGYRVTWDGNKKAIIFQSI
ncbi:copper amine oxidase N-terminal domain-containing protein [Neobacillus sp. MM2021_6]|uniref:copper amine oxidase N-terminal domain-containing protein n=1 Tax=Bacillaceae TaxID=186817 RepID=UPI001409FAC4|nr:MULTISPECIES: copper amine oxidase N-terminal domain-containing protein [Bacillaceae]MBO0962036.1 copper amine oxidase N-terminal domain-containing protein [Neobacillus sp. MM2021_6]NHC19943.1 copper amine oxidase N-terminal domain-containing protein [Bacillus sp. MM2020_4]